MLRRALTNRRSVRPNQDGFVLIIVLGLVFVCAVIGLAVLSLTQTTAKVVSGAAKTTESVRAIDGSLEQAVSQFRLDDTAVAKSCADVSGNPKKIVNANEVSGDFVVGTRTFEVKCDDSTGAATDWNAGSRDVIMTVTYSGQTTVVGRARVKIQDVTNNTRLVGFTLEVCDWQLGAAVFSTLNGCAA